MEQEYLLKHMMPDKMKYDEYKQKDNTYPWECIDTCKNMNNMMHMHNMHMKPDYHMHSEQHIPIQNMGSKVYAFVYEKVLISLNKFMPDMTKMPKAISKDNFNMIVNDCMTTLTKDEKLLKDMLKSRCVDCIEQDRAFCPFCSGMLKSVVEIALITSLINGGCAFCY